MFKKISFLFFLSSTFLFLTGIKTINAQGAYQCSCTSDTLGGANCIISTSYCDNDFKPNCTNCRTYTSPTFCLSNPSSPLCGGSFTDTCISGTRRPPGGTCICSGDCVYGSFCNVPIGSSSGTCVQCCASAGDSSGCPTIPNYVASCTYNGSGVCSSNYMCAYTAVTPTPESGTYNCYCSANTIAGWDCEVSVNNCNSGYIPNIDNCPSHTNNDAFTVNGCSPYWTSCTDACVAGTIIEPGGEGCTNDYECPSGYFCNTPDIPVTGATYSCMHCCTHASDCPTEYGINSLCDVNVSTSHCTSGLACSRTRSQTYCGRYGEPCCENGDCDESQGLACNTDLGICLSSDRSCACVPQGQPECLITDRCGRGYAEQCTGIANGYCTSSGCSCVVDYEPESESMNLSRLYGAIQSAGGLFRFSSSLTLGEIVSNILTIIFPLAGLVLLLMLIYGGYNLMFSAGDPKKAQASREIVTTALIGFAIIFIAFWLTIIVGRILGLSDIFDIF